MLQLLFATISITIGATDVQNQQLLIINQIYNLPLWKIVAIFMASLSGSIGRIGRIREYDSFLEFLFKEIILNTLVVFAFFPFLAIFLDWLIMYVAPERKSDIFLRLWAELGASVLVAFFGYQSLFLAIKQMWEVFVNKIVEKIPTLSKPTNKK